MTKYEYCLKMKGVCERLAKKKPDFADVYKAAAEGFHSWALSMSAEDAAEEADSKMRAICARHGLEAL